MTRFIKLLLACWLLSSSTAWAAMNSCPAGGCAGTPPTGAWAWNPSTKTFNYDNGGTWAPITSVATAANTCTYFVDNSATGCGGSGCSDSNNGTSLATAWLTLTKLGTQTLSAGQTACLVGQRNPNTTNGGIWRAQQFVPAYNTTGTGWGAGKQVTITSYDPNVPAIVTSAQCYGAASGLCTGSTPITWHQCTSDDALCNRSTDPNITNVYEYTRPNAVYAAIYVDDPDVINGTTLWSDQTKFLRGASGLPGASSSRAINKYQGDMTTGTWWDDGTHLYIWMVANADPSAHVIEAPTLPAPGQGIVRSIALASHREYMYYSYLKFEYLVGDALDTEASNSTDPLYVWYDHITAGGSGAGPVTNGGSGFYVNILYALGTSGAQPAGAIPDGGEIHYTNNTLNWCGSHNCAGVDGSKGSITYSNNNEGTSEHSGFDIKCPYNVSETSNYAHDGYTGTIVGADPTGKQNAFYAELDWATCSGGTITWQNNTGYNVNVGIFPNANLGSAANFTANIYNNTITLQQNTGIANSCFYIQSLASQTLTSDVENNICATGYASNFGYQRATAAGTYANTEQYNLYYNSSGTNTNHINATDYTTLLTWQGASGGGSSYGTGDIWQSDPLLTRISNNQYALDSSSPARTAGSGLVGSSPTMGAVVDPLIESSRWGHVLIPAVVAGGGNATATLLASCTGAGCTDTNRLANGSNAGTLTITTPASTAMADGEELYVNVADSGTAPSAINWTAGSGVTFKSAVLGDTDATPGAAAACGTPPATGNVIYKWRWDAVAGTLRLLACGPDPSGTVLSSTLGGLGVAPTQYDVQVGGASGAAMTQVAPGATSGVPLIGQGAAANPVFGTALVAGGGTGLTTLTAHAVYAGNGTSAPTAVGPDSATVKVLTSAGASADPAFQYLPFRPGFNFSTPTASQNISYALPGAVAFPANFGGSPAWPDANSVGSKVSTIPSETDDYVVYCDTATGSACGGTQLGTASCAITTGAWTFTTVGGATKTCAAGNTLRVCAPGTVSGTGVAFTLAGHWTS